MKENNIKTTPNNPPVNSYDDGNIPEADLPQNRVSDQPIEPLPEQHVHVKMVLAETS